jgi:hypothetical protein
MFKSGMKEQTTGIVEMKDIDAKTMKAFFERSRVGAFQDS